MFTDLLIQYGLIGAIIYYLMLLALLRFVWLAKNECNDHIDIRPYGLFLVTNVFALILYNSVGGAFFPVYQFWLVVILSVAMRVHARELVDERELAKKKRGGEDEDERPVRVATPGMVPAR